MYGMCCFLLASYQLLICFIGRVAFLNDHFTMKYKDLNILSIMVRIFMTEKADHCKIRSKFESLTQIAVDLPGI